MTTLDSKPVVRVSYPDNVVLWVGGGRQRTKGNNHQTNRQDAEIWASADHLCASQDDDDDNDRGLHKLFCTLIFTVVQISFISMDSIDIDLNSKRITGLMNT